jgi:hypothetical protein
MVPETGLEPARLFRANDPKSFAYTLIPPLWPLFRFRRIAKPPHYNKRVRLRLWCQYYDRDASVLANEKMILGKVPD